MVGKASDYKFRVGDVVRFRESVGTVIAVDLRETATYGNCYAISNMSPMNAANNDVASFITTWNDSTYGRSIEEHFVIIDDLETGDYGAIGWGHEGDLEHSRVKNTMVARKMNKGKIKEIKGDWLILK